MKQARDYRKYNVRLTSADWQRGSCRVINVFMHACMYVCMHVCIFVPQSARHSARRSLIGSLIGALCGIDESLVKYARIENVCIYRRADYTGITIYV